LGYQSQARPKLGSPGTETPATTSANLIPSLLPKKIFIAQKTLKKTLYGTYLLLCFLQLLRVACAAESLAYQMTHCG
jgi:hypothetical protein